VVLYAYIKLRLKVSFKETLGSGDIILFVMLTLAFSNISFYVLFISALVFSLVLHLILNRNKKENDVPLAGYMSGFFMLVFLGFWSGLIDNLYSL
jgi:apolipoprotein N-acyltransferase